MRIKEIRHKLRSHGPNIGKPAIHLILDEEGMNIENEKIIETIKQHECYFLVITGDEPLKQQLELIYFLTILKEKVRRRIKIEIETNGTIMPDYNIRPLVDLWNIEIPKEDYYVNKDSIMFFSEQSNAVFRFKVKSKNQFYVLLQKIDGEWNIDRERVFLQNYMRNLKGTMWLVEKCKFFNFNYGIELKVDYDEKPKQRSN